eukprot:CAMPEP_0168322984 /NCGR_PEP_ID=MMETSP0213-20121227/3221_1 /TAXON_ID=151035 /ORGANISM="Euplotes harpa, Strain FSP1.4" /LENGTH=59 /DNA_ID=CAMNT_0008324989 /DNA_START=1 /DNA_END=177 /DNA_ORIENTATION=-
MRYRDSIYSVNLGGINHSQFNRPDNSIIQNPVEVSNLRNSVNWNVPKLLNVNKTVEKHE